MKLLLGDYTLSFRIRRVYFDQIVAGEKRSEIRRASRYWSIRAARAIMTDDRVVAVFVCGKRVHRRRIINVLMRRNAELALHRKPSSQGRKDLGRGRVWEFVLGKKC